ncbi:MAG: hypothetical protein JSW02_04770 [candidate division WOR-3 bacterium]|nr:MAG: hypothetical protein JSW02_04770 [candidate division WOR-3 bacterium]
MPRNHNVKTEQVNIFSLTARVQRIYYFMAIADNWRKLIPEQILNAPDVPGVYELSDILQDVLYIGHTSTLNQTIQQIADRKDPDFAMATFFRFAAVKEHEQEYQKLLEEYKQKNGGLPPINKKKEQG